MRHSIMSYVSLDEGDYVVSYGVYGEERNPASWKTAVVFVKNKSDNSSIWPYDFRQYEFDGKYLKINDTAFDFDKSDNLKRIGYNDPSGKVRMFTFSSTKLRDAFCCFDHEAISEKDVILLWKSLQQLNDSSTIIFDPHVVVQGASSDPKSLLSGPNSDENSDTNHFDVINPIDVPNEKR